MTPAAVGELLEVGHVVEVPSRAVRCSCCEEPTDSPVFMGVSADGARLPLWWCESCKVRFGERKDGIGESRGECGPEAGVTDRLGVVTRHACPRAGEATS